ncbi:MAG: cupin domain-containing protein [Calditrichaeota bacterium]|nr:cupin domain-containing protein [Calditrichota bacterium]
MGEIRIIHKPDKKLLEEMDVFNWSVWEQGESEFPWYYDEQEICYFLEGEVVVTPEGGTPVEMGKGDLVTFPAGMSCIWKIRKAVKKHFSFGE